MIYNFIYGTYTNLSVHYEFKLHAPDSIIFFFTTNKSNFAAINQMIMTQTK